LFAVGARRKAAGHSHVQRDVGPEFERADVESAGRDQHRAAAVVMAGINGRLDRSRVERDAVALRAVVTVVVDTRASIVFAGRILRAKQRRTERRGGLHGYGKAL
jgi:hypothetical protein